MMGYGWVTCFYILIISVYLTLLFNIYIKLLLSICSCA